jgi:hypothetical protein
MAALDPITAIFNFAGSLIDRIIPDKTAAAAAKAQLVDMQVSGELAQIQGQITVDNTEAASNSIFVAGWRPFCGWTCAFALAYVFILQPFAITIAVLCHSSFDVTKLPSVSLTDMLPILLGMLGLGTLRTIDKSNGTGNGH